MLKLSFTECLPDKSHWSLFWEVVQMSLSYDCFAPLRTTVNTFVTFCVFFHFEKLFLHATGPMNVILMWTFELRTDTLSTFSTSQNTSCRYRIRTRGTWVWEDHCYQKQNKKEGLYMLKIDVWWLCLTISSHNKRNNFKKEMGVRGQKVILGVLDMKNARTTDLEEIYKDIWIRSK